MRANLFAIAVAALSFGAAAFAEPPKAAVHDASQASAQNAPLLVAAADTTSVADAQGQQQQAQPAVLDKPARHARVTTCRCGDQTPGN